MSRLNFVEESIGDIAEREELSSSPAQKKISPKSYKFFDLSNTNELDEKSGKNDQIFKNSKKRKSGKIEEIEKQDRKQG